jgi:alkylation response protein AidB-like acyl-CoA dehydrogenase
MNFEISPADVEFRAQAARNIRGALEELFGSRPDTGEPVHINDRESMRRWTCALDRMGYLVHHWPREWGGADWPVTWPKILEEELAAANAPPTDAIGVGFVGPLLCRFGSPEQKRRYLPRIRSAEEFWCQGFSEANAGSDTMSIRTFAARDRGSFIVNGQKLWTTNAHIADMMFALVRTAGPAGRPRQGLTFVLMNMRTEGLTVRPVILIDGKHRLNEVTLENVKVPAENMVGEEGKGWVYAQSLLADERTIVAGLGITRLLLGNLRRILCTAEAQGRKLIEDPDYRLRVTKLEVELEALEFLELRALHMKSSSTGPQVFPPILKLRGSELRQRVTELALEALGEAALETPGTSTGDPALQPPPLHATWATTSYLYQRAATILGGTSEIQRNIIAGVGLRL